MEPYLDNPLNRNQASLTLSLGLGKGRRLEPTSQKHQESRTLGARDETSFCYIQVSVPQGPKLVC